MENGKRRHSKLNSLLSMLLSVCLVATNISVTAFAEGESTHSNHKICNGISYAMDENGNQHTSSDNCTGHDIDEWIPSEELPTKPGNYYLTTDVTLTSSWITPEGIVNLC